MISYLMAMAALRRLRRRGEVVRPRVHIPMRRLLVGEVVHLTRTWVGSPRSVVVLLGVLAVVGTYVALGPTYPGLVVVAEPARVVGATGALVGAVVVARTVPATWRAAAQAWRRVRLAVLAIGFTALLSVVKVGLHEATPGPVLPAEARWALVALGGAATALLWSLDGGHRSSSGA